MAKLRVFKEIENSIFRVTFTQDAAALSEADKRLMKQYGEPIINVGGEFGTAPNDFTLPEKYVRIVSDLPYTVSFDAKAAPFNTATETKVSSFEDAIVDRFNDAFTTLRANSDVFTGESVYNI